MGVRKRLRDVWRRLRWLSRAKRSRRRGDLATRAAQSSWDIADDDWRNAEQADTFAKNADPAATHVVRTGQGAWCTSSHCFQCALNTVHECADFGKDIHTFPGIERKWLSACVSGAAHYPRVRYVVRYPERTPRLPYHDHPGGEEYLVLAGAFSDTNFPDVKAPAFVRYPIGTHHAAMTEPVIGARTEILTWWGLVQATSATETGRAHQLDAETLVPTRVAAAAEDGRRLVWPLSADGVETRIERWLDRGKVRWRRTHAELYVLRGRVALAGFPALPSRGADAAPPAVLELSEGDWCALPAHTPATCFRALEPATVLVKELWPYDDWRAARRRSVPGGKWASWKGGKAEGQGLVSASSPSKLAKRSSSAGELTRVEVS
mmetsp:Transcript_29050/g.86773  ORF Transcript_29050/g.86773 Transcript_29050/m.86773 type:complete len:378 (+) Transcript_29050:194-1327(+)